MTLKAYPTTLDGLANENRQLIVGAIKAESDLVSALQSWRSELYRVGGKAEVVANLHLNSDGTVMGFARDSRGQFIGHAHWTKVATVGSRLASAVTCLAGNAVLVEIAQTLVRIEAKVDRIESALKDDRMAELHGSIESANGAVSATQENRQYLATSAAAHLEQSILKIIAALKRDIVAAPTPYKWHLGRVLWDHSEDTRKSLREQQDVFRSAVLGIQTLARLYVAIGETEIAWRRAETLFNELAQSGLSVARSKARQITARDEDDFPEAFWAAATEFISESLRLVNKSAAHMGNSRSSMIELSFSEDQLDFIGAPVAAAPDTERG